MRRTTPCDKAQGKRSFANPAPRPHGQWRDRAGQRDMLCGILPPSRCVLRRTHDVPRADRNRNRDLPRGVAAPSGCALHQARAAFAHAKRRRRLSCTVDSDNPLAISCHHLIFKGQTIRLVTMLPIKQGSDGETHEHDTESGSTLRNSGRRQPRDSKARSVAQRRQAS